MIALHRVALLAFFALILTFTSGCSSGLQSEYGDTRGPYSSASLNGFAAFRQLYVNAGWRTSTKSRLSSQLNREQTLIWIPKSAATLDDEPLQWFDQWLSSETRTLIIIEPGYDALLDYWRDARAFASPGQRVEYRRREAQTLARLLMEPETQGYANLWYGVDPAPVQQFVERVAEGDDASGLESLVAASPRTWTTGQFVAERAEQPDDGTYLMAPDFTSILRTESNDVLLARLTNDAWGDSQVLVLANGAPLVNFAMIQPENRSFAQAIVEISGESGRVTFIETDATLQVMDDQDAIPRPSSTYLFTVWPLNLVTMHVAVVGLLVLLALAPIFGRPQQIESAERTDFGQHVTALAQLAARDDNRAYAERRVSDYFLMVRGEPDSPWVIPAKDSSLGKARPQAPARLGPLTFVEEPKPPRNRNPFEK